MKVTTVTFTCEGPSCNVATTLEAHQLDGGFPAGWRRVKIGFDDGEFPLFAGDLCPRCVVKLKELFSRPLLTGYIPVVVPEVEP